MAEDQDPIRLVLLGRLRRDVLPWLVRTALDFPEIREGLSLANLDENALAEDVRMADHVLSVGGIELAAVHRFACDADGRINEKRLRRELAMGDWPIRWAIYNATPAARVRTPTTLHEALSDWCTVLLRDAVVAELRRAINAHLPGSFDTVLNIGAIPGLKRVHDVSFTVKTESTKRFRAAVARTHGSGAIGLAGPRGSGKSALIDQYVAGMHRAGRGPASLGVAVSCPVHYEARDFVLHLHATLCQAVIERIDSPSTRRTWSRVLGTLRSGGALIVNILIWLAIAATATYVIVRPDFHHPLLPQLLHPATHYAVWMTPLLAVAGFSVAVATFAALELVRRVVTGLLNVAVTIPGIAVVGLSTLSGNGDDNNQLLKQSALRYQRQIKLLQTATTGWSGTITLPWAAAAGATKSVQLAERAQTYPEVVQSLRIFTQECVETLGPIVIAIDEVDKISSAERAQAFVNDIKGVFGVPGCLYLVSVSEDALVTFERSLLGIRDAFDSAFDEIVPIDYLSLADSLELLRSRVIGISEPFGCLCHCLSGGLPRELVRVVRRIADHRHEQGSRTLSTVCRELVRDEIAGKNREFRIIANRLTTQYNASPLGPLLQLRPDALAKELLGNATTLTRHRVTDALDPVADRLRREAAMLAYHCATLLEVFTDELDVARATNARTEPDLPGSFDQLSRARIAVVEDPYLAWALLDEFRDSWRLAVVAGR